MPQAHSKLSRNALCPCGSGKKYKKCCLATNELLKKQPLNSEKVAIQLKYAQTLESKGQMDSAEQEYRRLNTQYPREPQVLQALGTLLCRMERFSEGVTELKRAVELLQKQKLLPNRSWVLADIAMTILNARHPNEALAVVQKAKKAQPNHARMHYVLALCLERLNRSKEALRAAEQSHRLEPNQAIATTVLARLYRRMGDFEKANKLLTRLLQETTDTRTLSRVYREWSLVLDKTARYSEAFDTATKAGRETLKQPPFNQYDLSAIDRIVAANRSGFTAALLNRWSPRDFNDGLHAPVFLLGFFRSGTTLTEQVLAAHPKIVTTDETLFLYRTREELCRIVGATQSVPENAANLTLEQACYLRQFYWQQVNQHLGKLGSDTMVVDKNALNSIDIGLINVLFPEAKILFALRDPRDVCISCFLQTFSPSDLTVHLLTWQGCAHFYSQVMALWLSLREKLSLRFIEVRYEDTVVDLEGQARRILDLLGLDWNKEVLGFHEKARQRYIGTPSFSDVSKPIYQSAVARWRNYEIPINEVMPILKPFVEAFGYSEF